jgi:antitoxin component YwqK of YwqJK toxin-antitoxin module
MTGVTDGFHSFVVEPHAAVAGLPGFAALRYEGEYRDGRREGLWRVTEEGTGALCWEVTWSGGMWDGPSTSWWPNGNKEKRGDYHEGHNDGRWRFWFETGRLAAEGFYEAGRKVGRWSYWDEGGTAMPYDDWAERYEHWDWAYDDYTGFPHGENWPDPPAGQSPPVG